MDPIRRGAGSRGEIDQARVSAGINQILVELGHLPEAIDEWWNTTTYQALGGRTPTQAWLEGDREEVRDLIESMFEATYDARDRLMQSPDFVKLIARHQQTIR
jgi:hypothetical protein